MEIIALFLILLNVQLSTEKAKPSILEGKWKVYETYENKKQIFIMNRVQKKEEEDFTDRFGHFMEFNPDGTYIEHASAQCGLDDNRFSYSGLWKFNNLILDLGNIKVENARPNIYNKYKVRKGGKLRFISRKENELKFEIVKHWEKK